MKPEEIKKRDKIIFIISCLLLLVSTIYLAYKQGRQDGSASAFGFIECVKELGCDCNPKTEKPFIEKEKNVLRIYPICFRMGEE